MKLEKAILDSLVDAVVLLDESGIILFANQSCEQLLRQPSAGLVSRPAIDFPLLATTLSALKRTEGGLGRRSADGVRPLEIESPAAPGRGCLVLVRRIQTAGRRMWLFTFRETASASAIPASVEMAAVPLIRELVAGAAHEFNNLCTVAITTFDLALEAPSMSEVERRQVAEARRRMLSGAEKLKHLQAYVRRSELEPTLVSLAEAVDLTGWAAGCMFGPALQMKSEVPSDDVLSCEINRRELLLSLLVAVQMVARRLDGHGEIVMRLTKVGQPDSPSGSGGELGCLTLKGVRLRAEPPRVRTMERRRGLDGASNEALAHALAVWAELKGGRTSWSEGHAAEATWSLFLPLFGSDHVPPAASARTEPNRTTEGSGQQILVADDDSMVRALVSAALRREGMHVVEASDGEEAVSRLMEEPGAFGLVLLDLHMPRLGGQGALERLRAVKPALKAIFLTGSVAVDPPETRADAEVVRLQKPFVIADLLSAVRESLNA